jgi:hypothetical protein
MEYGAEQAPSMSKDNIGKAKRKRRHTDSNIKQIPDEAVKVVLRRV